MNINAQFFNTYKYYFILIAIGIIYFCNMFVDVMDVDAGQYASIAREMLEKNSYLEVFNRNKDYLDKPPLLFWLSALSMKTFGISNFFYKLPAILCLILGIYSTYRLALLWYEKKIARLSGFIIATTQAFFLMSNDVRTDGILTGFVMFSIWQLSAYIKEGNQFKNLCLASIGAAFAMMAKGPLALVIIGAAIGGDLLVKKDWKTIFKPQWFIFFLFIGILLIPMCYGLYTQFDLHPEKVAYEIKSPSGLKFFFWTQCFGRITGENTWNNGTSFFYFFHTILWDMQPWLLFFIFALIARVKQLMYYKKNTTQREFITLMGFVLCFLVLSKSGYKLPHYIFPLFPFAAIITADFFYSTFPNIRYYNYLKNIQYVLCNLFFIIIFISFIMFFEPSSFLYYVLLAFAFILFQYAFYTINDKVEKITLPTLIMVCMLNFVMASYFYPNLLLFQSQSTFGKDALAMNIPKDKLYFYNAHSHSLDFYSQCITKDADNLDKIKDLDVGTYLFTNEKDKNVIINTPQFNYKIVKEYNHFSVTGLTLPFLNKYTRASRLSKNYLLQKY